MIGYIVLGPDYFFGDHYQDHMEDPTFIDRRDQWFVQKLKAAQEAMPEWLKIVRETYGMPSHLLDAWYLGYR